MSVHTLIHGHIKRFIIDLTNCLSTLQNTVKTFLESAGKNNSEQ